MSQVNLFLGFLPQTCPGDQTPSQSIHRLNPQNYKLYILDASGTRIAPEDKKKERPREGRSML